jgi:hypothetical protein
MTFVKFQQYTPGQGFKVLPDYISWKHGEGEGDQDVIGRLGYTRSDVLFNEKTCEIIIYEVNDHSDYKLNPRFIFEIELPGHTDYIFIKNIGEFLEFNREYLPSIEILNKNSKGNELP